MPPPAGAGVCWYWVAKFVSPIVERMAFSVSSDSHSPLGLRRPRGEWRSIRPASGFRGVRPLRRSPGKEMTSKTPCFNTWPTRSSSCRRCMTMTIDPLAFSFSRENKVESNHSLTLMRRRWLMASAGLSGSSTRITSAPRPVSTPPTEVAMRNPPRVVAISRNGGRDEASRAETGRDTRARSSAPGSRGRTCRRGPARR